MEIRLKGIGSATKTLADGTRRTYYYAWRGGPLVCDEIGHPIGIDHEDFASIVLKTREARRSQKPSSETLSALIAEFKRSSEFTTKAEKTRSAYERYLAMIEKRFGRMPIAVVQDKRSRGDFKAWRDTFSDKPRTADYIWQTLARVLSVAKDNGRIAVNVCERGGRLYDVDRTELVWKDEHIEAFNSVASAPLKLALVLALWTGQREGDLLRLPWSAYDGATLRIHQSKTGSKVRIPVAQPLRQVLDVLPPNDGRILRNTLGQEWSEDGFRSSWTAATCRAGIEDLRFNDLRGTAVTRLAKAGCSIPEISAITGHSLSNAQAILDAHYLGGRFELAQSAIAKMEAI